MARLHHLPFRQGQHICAFYTTQDEQLSTAAAYISDGLACNERCLYAAESNSALEQFRQRLTMIGVDPKSAESRGALLLLTKHQAHLVNGHFDCERMLKMLNAAVEDALNAGFAGLRTCGDMSWLLDNAAGSEQVVEYEALLNQFFLQTRALGICQYDMARLPAGLLDHAGIAAHSSVLIDRTHTTNPFFAPAAVPASPSSREVLDGKLARLRRD